MIDAPFDLTDRVAIITGGGTGIGAETARVFARYGAHTVIGSRKVENLKKVAAEIEDATDRKCLTVQCDVRNEDDCVNLVAQTIEHFGRVDILVNNAGGSYLYPLKDTDVDRWDNMVNLNLRGPFVVTREAGRHMMEQGHGAIINISSGAGVSGVKGGAAYSAAKAGLQMFTRVVSAEWGKYGIRANCIAVGAIASEGALRSWTKAGMDPVEMGRSMPLGRVGQPEDIAYPVLFLACDAAQYLTGETISIAGGPGMGGLPDED